MRSHGRRLSTLLVAFVVVGASHAVHAVDGVIEINQARALKGGVTPGDTPGFPVTISVSGSYRLTSNLTLPDATTAGIDVAADNVSIDLNGFAIIGPATCSGGPPVTTCLPTPPLGQGNIGIDWRAFATGTTVKNGSIQGMSSIGLNLGRGARISGVTVRWSERNGILVGDGSTIIGCTLVENGSTAILAGTGLVASNNVVRGNNGYGIFPLGSSVVSGNTVQMNSWDGIRLQVTGGGSTVVANSITGNGGFGIACLTPGMDGYTQNVLLNNNGVGAQVSGCTQLGAGTNLCNGVACP